MTQDTDTWMRVLAGQEPADPKSRERVQTEQMRNYFKRRIEEDSAPFNDPEREKRMMNYLRANGMFAAPVRQLSFSDKVIAGIKNFLDTSRPGATGRLGLAVVVVLSFGLVPMLLQQSPIDKGGSDYRGDSAAQVVLDPQPEPKANQLKSQLDVIGVPARLVKKEFGWRLEAKLPPADRSRIEPILKASKIDWPGNNDLVVDFKAK